MTLAYLLDRHGKGWRWHRAAAVLFDVLQGYPGVDEDRKYRYCIYAALNSVGWAQGLQEKQPGTAEDLYQKAITVFREQAAKYPEREKIRYYLAEYASSFAHFLRGIDQKEDAEKLFREALEVSCRLIREYPENEQYRILARFTVGREMIDLLREMNREEEADKLTDFIVGL